MSTNARGQEAVTSESADGFEAVDLSSTDWTPSASFGAHSRGVLIGVAGNLKVDGARMGSGVTLAVPAGWCPIMVTKIYKTGTTATGITALS